ncbi:hypothetical protein P171DRAFT_434440 [Karstenula rhodostoma CBS 690.94]|uniref:Uncharacterized protein n=1 Tax=Karstenula rhodostoma CBS 690.94 TaxID=1392251 RepID=A0A9P4U942_9PLEO|nr:hypothetical protein P171DRAFT_434440 [Karstenula rhodostoma CBS 690.94]
MARCFLLHQADPEILLDVPGARYASLSDVFSRVFSSQERRSLHEIISFERHRQGKRRYCVVGSARWLNALRSIAEPLWLLSTSVMTKWNYDPYAAVEPPVVESGNDDDQTPLRFAVASNVLDVQQVQVLGCTVVLQNTEYSLQVPEMAVFCSHGTGYEPDGTHIDIIALYDGAVLGTAAFDPGIAMLNAEVVVWNNRSKGRARSRSHASPETMTVTQPKAITGATTEAMRGSEDASAPETHSPPEAMRDIHNNSVPDTLAPQEETPQPPPEVSSNPEPQTPEATSNPDPRNVLEPTHPPQSYISLDKTPPKAGRIAIQAQKGTKQRVRFNRPPQTGPRDGASLTPWLVSELRSRKLSELLDTLELLLFALGEATQVSLQIGLPRGSDVEAFTAFAEAVAAAPGVVRSTT